MCTDINGDTVTTTITAGTANRSKRTTITTTATTTTTTTDNSGPPLPPCDASPIDQFFYELWLWIGGLSAAAIFQLLGSLYCATLPLKNGNEDSTAKDKLTYEQRLVAVCTLFLVS